MKIAIVILNWNGEKLLEQFLPSVVKFSSNLATIYVADNASIDSSIAFLNKYYPSIHIIENKENGGYAKGYNDALKFVEEDIYILLNSDVEVTENWLNPFTTAFENDTNLAAAQPKILDFNKKEYFEYAGAAGGFIDKFGYPFCRGRIFDSIEKDNGQYNDIKEIFWATGACLVVKKDIFWQVGGFDEDFFAHQEEIDLCWRINAIGCKIKYIGTSEVYHLGGATLETSNPKKTFYNFRNTLFVLLKNVKGAKVWWLIFVRLILDGLAGVKFLIDGKPHHFLAIIRAHFSFYGQFQKFLKKRKKYATSTKYFYIKSIVFQYFISKITIFNNLR